MIKPLITLYCSEFSRRMRAYKLQDYYFLALQYMVISYFILEHTLFQVLCTREHI